MEIREIYPQILVALVKASPDIRKCKTFAHKFKKSLDKIKTKFEQLICFE